MASLEDLQKDAEEIRKFISTSARPRVKELLQRELLSVEQEIALLVHQKATHTTAPQEEETKPEAAASEEKQQKATLYTKTITQYGWDQSDKFVKIYITLPGVEKLSKEKVTSKFTKQSFEVVVHELDGKNHQLKIMKLCHNIVGEESYVKVKTGNLLVMMKKEKVKETWADVVSSKSSKVELPGMKGGKGGVDDKSQDPQNAIMDMMKKMYDEGDDEMKKTINKAWDESMNKTASGEGMAGLNLSGI